MTILGNILGGVIFVAVILWLLITIASFFTFWISMMLTIFQAFPIRWLSKRGEKMTLVERYSKNNEILVEILTGERYQKRRRVLAVSASIFVVSMLIGGAVMLAANKMQA